METPEQARSCIWSSRTNIVLFGFSSPYRYALSNAPLGQANTWRRRSDWRKTEGAGVRQSYFALAAVPCPNTGSPAATSATSAISPAAWGLDTSRRIRIWVGLTALP